MAENRSMRKTIMPSGVFRQPREDILQESVSQGLVSQDSLCKVSDFEISIHSKNNLPDLYNVDGKGRAVYWLYKHSLADSESVRNSKTRSGVTTEASLLLSNGSRTNASVLTTLKRTEKNAPLNGRKLKKGLCKLRDMFLSSTTSDIEIKETYNSYINLEDLETIDLLLKRNDDLSLDKYDNLIMNLEMRKIMLEKKQIENYKRRLKENMKNKSKQSERYKHSLGKSQNHKNNHSENEKKHKKSNKNEKTISLVSKSTGTDLLTRSGLEANDLDHILNQIKFFLQSDKINNITEAQKDQLEEYLCALTKNSDRIYIKKKLQEGSIRSKLKGTIRESLRNIIYTTERIQTSSLIVENDSASDTEDIPSIKSIRSLRGSKAQSNITVSATPVAPSIARDEPEFKSSYHSIQSDSPSERELNCQDLRYSCVIDESVTLDSKDELIFRQYHLDPNNDLLNFTGTKKPKTSKQKEKGHEKRKDRLDKFKNIRNFDETDTLNSLEIKQKEKSFKHKVKYPPQCSSSNVCIMDPDNVSYNGELDKMQGMEVLLTQSSDELQKHNVHKSKHTSNEKNSQNFVKRNELTPKLPKKQKSNDTEISNESSKKSSSKSMNKEKKECSDYVCFKDTIQISSESGYDTKNIKKVPTIKENKIKSSSYPKTKKDIVHKILDSLDEKKDKHKERKRREKKEEKKEKVIQSDNCIENQEIKMKVREKFFKREQNSDDENVKVELNLPIEEKSIEFDKIEENSDEYDYHMFLKDNMSGNSLKLSSCAKKIKSCKDDVLGSNFIDSDAQTGNKECVSKSTSYHPTKFETSDYLKASRLTVPKEESSTSNHVIQINDSLIHLDDKNIFETTEPESMETFLRNDVLSKLRKSLAHNESENITDCSVNIPIYKRGFEIARITRQSPSCAYTIKKYAQKMNKSTQMFEHVTRNDLYTLQWIHDNLFEININPHTLIVDEKIKEVSEMSDVS